jgi:hypothetical protein
MSQQARKEQEGVVVRRLTIGAGAATLGLAWYFTSAAATAAPVTFDAQPAGDAQQPVIGVEQLDDRVFVRTVHVPAIRPPAGGVKAGPQQTAGPTQAATSAPIAQPVPAPSAPAPAPTTVATTAPTPPVKK